MKALVATLLVVFGSTTAFAQARRPSMPAIPRTTPAGGDGSRLTYDLGASTGNYNGATYNEITLGLNYFLSDWFNWRNAIFTRQGTGLKTTQGLDSSMRFYTSTKSESGSFGLEAFAGPGVRLANNNGNALFAEGGVIAKLGGLRVGVGGKYLNYIATQDDGAGGTLPKNDSQIFIILQGSGTL